MDRIACRHSSTYDWTDSHDEDTDKESCPCVGPDALLNPNNSLHPLHITSFGTCMSAFAPRACLHTRLYSTAGIDPVPPAPFLSFSNLSMLKPPVLAHINSTLNVPGRCPLCTLC